jgi:hypothetical protein
VVVSESVVVVDAVVTTAEGVGGSRFEVGGEDPEPEQATSKLIRPAPTMILISNLVLSAI